MDQSSGYDAYIRQILTTKVDPGAVGVNVGVEDDICPRNILVQVYKIYALHKKPNKASTRGPMYETRAP